MTEMEGCDVTRGGLKFMEGMRTDVGPGEDGPIKKMAVPEIANPNNLIILQLLHKAKFSKFSWFHGEEEQIEIADEAVEEESLETPAKKSRNKKSYTIARKLEIVDYAKKINSINGAAKKYNVGGNMIRNWKDKEAQLRRTNCFKKFEAKLTFEESAQKCHSFGSELASFHYRREFDFLVALCDQTTEADDPTQSTTPFCWIGILSDGIPKIDVPVYEKNRFKLSFVDGSEVPEFPGDDEYSHYWGHTHAHGHEPNGYIQPDSRRVDRCVRLMQSNSILYPNGSTITCVRQLLRSFAKTRTDCNQSISKHPKKQKHI
uniref:Brinker DNA-binding domain-containing protein n=1 Tax=Ditylenchus dipsaci TaxID=166011 RepID=A0A915DB89_9BILA